MRPGGCAAFTWDSGTEAVAIAVEVEPQPDRDDAWRSQLMDSIRAAVADGHGIQLSVIFLLEPGMLPKTTSGKVQRYACRDACRAGSLAAVARWQAPDLAWPLEQTA